MTTTTTSPSTETALCIKRVFAAPRPRVFDAWTLPDHLKKWFAPSDDYDIPVAELDLRVGGRYRIVMRHIAKDIRHTVIGVYREIRPQERLVYTWSWEDDPGSGETLVTVEFRDLGNSTEVTIKHEQFASIDARDKHNMGWMGCLGRLVKAL